VQAANVPFATTEGTQMLALAATLNSYNSGSMNVSACSGNGARESLDANATFDFQLSHSPNPVTTSAIISFLLPLSQHISLRAYDVNGRIIQTLNDGAFSEGQHQLVWNTEKIDAGIYFLRMEAGDFSQTEKISILK
jgi:hypothetical protein